MKRFKLNINGKKITREIPSCIEEVTLEMYCNILEAFKSANNDYALLSGVLGLTIDEVLAIPDIHINDLFYHLQWINNKELEKLTKTKLPKYFDLPENKIKLNQNVGEYSLGQFEDANISKRDISH